MPEGILRIVNWNIGGAKYLELKSAKHCASREDSREVFRDRLNAGLAHLIETYQPDVVTLQEVARYQEIGRLGKAENVVDCPSGYSYFPYCLIDTVRHSHQGKWNKVRRQGKWSRKAFFAQGNALLIKHDTPYFPIWSIPTVGQRPADFWPKQQFKRWDDPAQGCIEAVKLESGLYFGDRNTEPRAGLVAHLVLDQLRVRNQLESQLLKPLDVFIVNLHLTTLVAEREGIPDIDEEASQTRLRQLDIVLNGIVSRYNRWRKDGYKIRGKAPALRKGKDTDKRYPPIWVITGDFNFTPESVEYQTMVRRGFIDMMPKRARHQVPHHQPTKAPGIGNDPTITLDYLFAGPRFEAIDPSYNEDHIGNNRVDTDEIVRVSDHYPLIVDLPIRLD